MSNPIDLCNLTDVRSWLNTQPGPVSTVAITHPGTGYTHVTITAVSVDGNGSGATFTGTVAGGALTLITKTTPGSGYTQPPNLVVTGDGTGATAVAYLAEDVKLSRLITSCSQMFLSRTGRLSFGPTTVTERRNGNGASMMTPYWWPLLSVASVQINGFLVPASSNGVQGGWINDEFAIYLVGGGAFPQAPALAPFSFWLGSQNVILTYTYGWATVPTDIEQAVIELVAQKYRRSQHVDQVSQAAPAGAGTVTFSQKDIPAEVATMINNYRLKAVIE